MCYSRAELQNARKKKTKDLRLEEEKKQDVIARKGLAGMSGATLRSLMLLDQVGGLAGK